MFGRINGIPIDTLRTPDHVPAPCAWWTLRELHGGDAFENIKRGLIGAPLPIRRPRDQPTSRGVVEILSGDSYEIPNAITFTNRDVVKSLLLVNAPEAAKFWYERVRVDSSLTFEMEKGGFIPTQDVMRNFPLFNLYDNGALSVLDMQA